MFNVVKFKSFSKYNTFISIKLIKFSRGEFLTQGRTMRVRKSFGGLRCTRYTIGVCIDEHYYSCLANNCPQSGS